MTKKQHLITSFVLTVFSGMVVSFFILLGSYSQVMADDFCTIYYSEKFGVLRSVWYWYITWHGGFSASFADGMMGLFGRNGIGFITPLAIVVWIIVLTWVASLIFESLNGSKNLFLSISVALFILSVTFIASPATSASVIWWGGLRGYVAPLIISPFYFLIYLLFSQKERKSKFNSLWYLASFVITFGNGGFSEPFTPLQLILIATLFLKNTFYEKRVWHASKQKFLSWGFLGAASSLIVMVMAPGNSQRQQYYPAPPSPFGIVTLGLKNFLAFLSDAFSDPLKAFSLIGVVCAGILLGVLFAGKYRSNNIRALLVFLVGFTFALCTFLPAAYGQSTGPSEQSLIIPTYILVITLLVTGFMSSSILSEQVRMNPGRSFVITLVLLLLFLGYSGIWEAQILSANVPIAAGYTNAWSARDQQIKDARQAGREEVTVPAIKNWITMEPSDNPRYFVNHCMSLYYGIHVLSYSSANQEFNPIVP